MKGENLHSKKKKMIAELIKGKEVATQLRTLLEKPAEDQVASTEELLHQILQSFSKSISQLSSFLPSAASTQIPGAAVDSGERMKKSPPAGFKNRRGCYKRRRASDSWTVESSTTEDGFAWRKYGQKVILNTNFPRCYYRCTHKYELGCKATKQLQKMKAAGKITFFQTTYINHHTCTKASTSAYKADNDSHLIKFHPSNSVESNNLMSFQTEQVDDDDVDNISKPPTAANPAVKLEQQKSTTTTDDQSEVVSDAKSTTRVQEYKLEWGYQAGLEEMGSGHEYGMEVDQFGDIYDIANFFCFHDNNM